MNKKITIAAALLALVTVSVFALSGAQNASAVELQDSAQPAQTPPAQGTCGAGSCAAGCGCGCGGNPNNCGCGR